MDKCQRCKSKAISLTCLDCESFQCLCTQCDIYLHTLPTKKNHKRLSNESLQQTAQRLNNQSLNQIDEASLLKNQTGQSQPSDIISQMPLSNNTSTSLESKFFYASHYSKDYLNEIKSIFQKEKGELEFKNKTLQTNLDRLKLSFTEQMNSLTSQLEDIQNKHVATIKSIQANSEIQRAEVINQKNAEIEALNRRINDALQMNEALSNEREEDRRMAHKKITEANDKAAQLELLLEKKSDEVLKLKCSFDTMMSQNESLIQEQRQTIVNEYENKINSILNDFDMSKEKLMKVVEEREVDIRNIIESNRTEGNDYNIVIAKLQKEVECHKANILKLRDERDYLREQHNDMVNKENGYLSNGQSQDYEIRRLIDENQKLLSENDELKIQLSKLDKLIYGKIRSNNFK